jgi:hypothetical protein
LAGLNKHTDLPITHVPFAVLEAAEKEARQAYRVYARTKTVTRKKQKLLRDLKKPAQDYAVICRDALRPALGNVLSSEWAEVGWKNTFSIPAAAEDLAELFRSISSFLSEHPELEVKTPKYEVTADEAEAHLKALEEAINAVGDAKTDQRDKREKREEADAKLLTKMRCLIKELEAILSADDPRWLDFVKEIPADESRPEPVEELVVEPGGPGELEGEFEPGSRSDRFQIEILVVGQDEVFRRVKTVRDPNFTLSDLPPGAQVKVRIIAANDTGESAPSAVVIAQVPSPQTKVA